MSAIIQRAKKSYQKILKIEVGILVGALLVAGGLGADMRSFLLGALAGFLPQCLFVYWIFRSTRHQTQQLGAFYKAEGLKWALAVILLVIVLTSYVALSSAVFFVGYFLAILLNSLLPIFFNAK